MYNQVSNRKLNKHLNKFSNINHFNP